MGALIGHEAYREHGSLPNDVNVRDFHAVYRWALETSKRALADWMFWRWEQGYLRDLDEGLEPATIYFAIAVPQRRGGEWVETMYRLSDEDGTPRLVLFGRYGDARQYCTEWAALDEAPAKERQDETGELVRSSRVRGWEPKGLLLRAVKPRYADKPVILDPTVEGEPGTRMTIAELEDHD